jgi:hypothetical protein
MSLGLATVIGVVVLAVLVWLFLRARSQDQLTEIVQKRRAGSKLVSMAEYVEGLEKIPVVMALSDDTFFYENADLQASFELARLDEIEYDNELATGRAVGEGNRTLRLRSHGATFEYILPAAEAAKWESALPVRRVGQSAARVG